MTAPGRLLASGVQADVYLTRRTALAVVKVVRGPQDGDDPRLRPHNAAREARLLSRLKHPNIVALLDYTYDGEHWLTLEALPLPLSDLLGSEPRFAEGAFMYVARGLFSALAFLHAHGVAHRDVKPGNILLSAEGVVKLVDLATAWEGGKGDDGEGGMVCQVGTGPYRAPELLFGPLTYDAPALDLWAAGATLADFYHPLWGPACPSPGSSGSSSSWREGSPVMGGPCASHDESGVGPAHLFDASLGELGLAGSIFSVLGTPTPDTWPSFNTLPDADKIYFDPQPPQSLAAVLRASAGPVSVLEAVLRLDPARRASAEDVLAIVDTWYGEGRGRDREVRECVRELAQRRMGELHRFLDTVERYA